MKTVLIALILATIACAGFMIAKPKYLSYNVEFYNQAEANEKNIEMLLDSFAKAHQAPRKYLSDFTIYLVDTPICVPGEKTMTVADGITLGNKIIASTLRGCYDSLTHELGHLLQLRMYKKKDPDHKDREYWDFINQLEEWTVRVFCPQGKKDITPEEAAKLCAGGP